MNIREVVSDLLRAEKLPYLLIGVFSLLGLLFTSISNQIFNANDDIIEYKVAKTDEIFNQSKAIWSAKYKYSIKNISSRAIDTTRIDFVLEPDTIAQKNIIVNHNIKPIGTTSIRDFSIDRVPRLSVVKLWNYLPGAEYQYTITTETTAKDIDPQVSIRGNRASFNGQNGAIRLIKENMQTWFIQNKLLLSFTCLFILIGTIFIYLLLLKTKP